MIYAPNNERDLLIWELPDVYARHGVRLVQSSRKQMRKFVELSEFPLRERRVPTTADVGRVLVVFLEKHMSRLVTKLNGVMRWCTYIEVAEEGIHDEIKDDEWGEYGIEDAHENEASPQSFTELH